MTILITGGYGLIGSQLTRMLLDAGYTVIVYDSQRSFAKISNYRQAVKRRIPLLEGARLITGDVRDRVLFREVLQAFDPDVVVHLAAISVFNPRSPYDKALFDFNLYASNVVFEESASTGVQRVVFASSSMAYGHFVTNPQKEDAILQPVDRYGVTKAASELLFRQTMEDAKKEWIIIRPTSVYGPTDCNNRVIQKFVEAGVRGDEEITATIGEGLDFTYVKDAAQGFQLAIETKNANEIYNISAGESHQVTEAAELVKQRFPNLRILTQDKASDGYRPVRGALDITKAKAMLGYQPEFSLEKGINIYIDYCLANK